MNCKTAVKLLPSVLLLIISGCTAPPSVVPLLQVSSSAMADEAERLRRDIDVDHLVVERTRTTLADAFAADLRQQDELTSAWVIEAIDVYVAAREALLARETEAAQQKQQRADNLEAAAEATQRAIDLLQRRDQLLSDTAVARLWRLLGESE